MIWGAASPAFSGLVALDGFLGNAEVSWNQIGVKRMSRLHFLLGDVADSLKISFCQDGRRKGVLKSGDLIEWGSGGLGRVINVSLTFHLIPDVYH